MNFNKKFKTQYSLIIFLIFSIILNLFLTNTVHKRDANIVFSESVPGTTLGVERWLTEGFTDGLGFWWKNEDKVHRSYNAGWLHLNYFTQYLFLKINKVEKINHNLMSKQNLIYSMITSIILAFLCYKIFLHYNFSLFSSIFMSISAQSLYITFPVHLVQYFELYPPTLFLIFFSLFIYIFYNSLIDKIRISNTNSFLVFLIGFFCGYMDWYAAFFSIIWIFLLLLFFDKKILSNKLFKFFIYGFVFFMCFYISQLILLKFFYNISFTGKSFLFRSGLDGDMAYFATHLDLLHSKFRKLNRVYQWYSYMFLALICIILFVKDFFQNKIFTPKELILFLSPVGLFLPYFLIFPQSTIIHPYYTDPYFFYFLFFLTGIYMPVHLKKIHMNENLLLFAYCLINVIFTFYHLRLFSIGFPLDFIFGSRGLF